MLKEHPLGESETIESVDVIKTHNLTRKKMQLFGFQHLEFVPFIIRNQ